MDEKLYSDNTPYAAEFDNIHYNSVKENIITYFASMEGSAGLKSSKLDEFLEFIGFKAIITSEEDKDNLLSFLLQTELEESNGTSEDCVSLNSCLLAFEILVGETKAGLSKRLSSSKEIDSNRNYGYQNAMPFANKIEEAEMEMEEEGDENAIQKVNFSQLDINEEMLIETKNLLELIFSEDFSSSLDANGSKEAGKLKNNLMGKRSFTLPDIAIILNNHPFIKLTCYELSIVLSRMFHEEIKVIDESLKQSIIQIINEELHKDFNKDPRIPGIDYIKIKKGFSSVGNNGNQINYLFEEIEDIFVSLIKDEEMAHNDHRFLLDSMTKVFAFHGNILSEWVDSIKILKAPNSNTFDSIESGNKDISHRLHAMIDHINDMISKDKLRYGSTLSFEKRIQILEREYKNCLTVLMSYESVINQFESSMQNKGVSTKMEDILNLHQELNSQISENSQLKESIKGLQLKVEFLKSERNMKSVKITDLEIEKDRVIESFNLRMLELENQIRRLESENSSLLVKMNTKQCPCEDQEQESKLSKRTRDLFHTEKKTVKIVSDINNTNIKIANAFDSPLNRSNNSFIEDMLSTSAHRASSAKKFNSVPRKVMSTQNLIKIGSAELKEFDFDKFKLNNDNNVIRRRDNISLIKNNVSESYLNRSSKTSNAFRFKSVTHASELPKEIKELSTQHLLTLCIQMDNKLMNAKSMIDCKLMEISNLKKKNDEMAAKLSQLMREIHILKTEKQKAEEKYYEANRDLEMYTLTKSDERSNADYTINSPIRQKSKPELIENLDSDNMQGFRLRTIDSSEGQSNRQSLKQINFKEVQTVNTFNLREPNQPFDIAKVENFGFFLRKDQPKVIVSNESFFEIFGTRRNRLRSNLTALSDDLFFDSERKRKNESMNIINNNNSHTYNIFFNKCYNKKLKDEQVGLEFRSEAKKEGVDIDYQGLQPNETKTLRNSLTCKKTNPALDQLGSAPVMKFVSEIRSRIKTILTLNMKTNVQDNNNEVDQSSNPDGASQGVANPKCMNNLFSQSADPFQKRQFLNATKSRGLDKNNNNLKKSFKKYETINPKLTPDQKQAIVSSFHNNAELERVKEEDEDLPAENYRNPNLNESQFDYVDLAKSQIIYNLLNEAHDNYNTFYSSDVVQITSLENKVKRRLLLTNKFIYLLDFSNRILQSHSQSDISQVVLSKRNLKIVVFQFKKLKDDLIFLDDHRNDMTAFLSAVAESNQIVIDRKNIYFGEQNGEAKVTHKSNISLPKCLIDENTSKIVFYPSAIEVNLNGEAMKLAMTINNGLFSIIKFSSYLNNKQKKLSLIGFTGTATEEQFLHFSELGILIIKDHRRSILNFIYLEKAHIQLQSKQAHKIKKMENHIKATSLEDVALKAILLNKSDLSNGNQINDDLSIKITSSTAEEIELRVSSNREVELWLEELRKHINPLPKTRQFIL